MFSINILCVMSNFSFKGDTLCRLIPSGGIDLFTPRIVFCEDTISRDTGSNNCVNLIMPHYYLPLISQPARITTTTSTLIDNIFTNLPQCVVETVIVVSDISDHLPLLTWLNTTQIHAPKASTDKYTAHWPGTNCKI